MAYEFGLQETEGPFAENDGSHVVEFILGFDAEADTIVVMSVMLVPTDREDTLELCFGIRTKVGADISGVSPPDYSKEGSDKYIPKERKSEILVRVAEAVESVVAGTRPRYITMETFYANLPPAALEKYAVIGARIIANGYIIADSFRDQDSGINYWLFEKRH
jgi:hypothetical protein